MTTICLIHCRSPRGDAVPSAARSAAGSIDATVKNTAGASRGLGLIGSSNGFGPHLRSPGWQRSRRADATERIELMWPICDTRMMASASLVRPVGDAGVDRAPDQAYEWNNSIMHD